MSNRRLGAWMLVGAALLLSLARLSNASGVALYDGLTILPPYRYLHPSSGAGTGRPPASGRVVAQVRAGRSPVVSAVTREQSPQAIFAALSGALRVPSHVTRITITIRPVSPPAPITGGSLDGNVYLFAAAGNDGESIGLERHAQAHIQLRETDAESGVVIERYTEGAWRRQPRSAFAEEHYVATDARSLGYYALVLPSGANGRASPSRPLLITGILVILLTAAGLLLLRRAWRAL